MEIWSDIYTWFWNEDVWLPPNTTWHDISDTSAVNYAQFSDLRNGFKVALAFLIVRYVLEKYVFSPIGQYFGLKPKVNRKVNSDTAENKVLEQAFCKNRRLNQKQVQGLAKQLDWNERRVERWIRRRFLREKSTNLSKFKESAWKFTFYFSATCYGLYILWDKPWFWKSSYCWYEYPHHGVTDDIWWYYMFELGFYWSLLVTQFTDTKRKDFLPMFLHHIFTILLLLFSWTSNFIRIGSLMLIIHDFADIPIEAARMAKYVGNQRVADTCFAVFTVSWILSRHVIYPYRIMYSTMYEAPCILPMFPAYYVFNPIICALQVLHILWTRMIVKAALCAISSRSSVTNMGTDSDESASNTSENEASTKSTSSQINSTSSQSTH